MYLLSVGEKTGTVVELLRAMERGWNEEGVQIFKKTCLKCIVSHTTQSKALFYVKQILINKNRKL